MIRLIIFDLDGTLIDSSIDITNAINYAVGPYGIAPLTVKETISIVGEGITSLMAKIAKRQEAYDIDKDALVQRFVEYYSAHLTDNTPVYPGVAETLKLLGDYKKVVISNKREAMSQKILDDLGLSACLDLVVGSDTTPERKPSPVPVLYVLSRLGIMPEEAVIVGDSNFDIEAGKAAGIRTVAVTYGYRPLEVLKDAGFIIDRMQDLPNILKRLS